ncbi:MAG: hypothetical protein ACI4XM_02370 [Candidatus Coprovivens sp.]
MKNETIRNMAGIILFYLFIVLGVVAINARMASISENANVVTMSN